MQATGIICEYNPFHLGHKKQLDRVRREKGGAIVCLMSGNFVQRGHPAIFDKTRRAEAAVRSGADLVLELPVTCALSSAEGFAAGGVSILSRICTELCFGAENPDPAVLLDTAHALLSPEFPPALRRHLNEGRSFPAARQAALADLGLHGTLLEAPNNILAVEYCKAILAQNAPLRPFPIPREGSYHAAAPDAENPSASAVRMLLEKGGDCTRYIPTEALPCLEGAAIHTLAAGERAILARLRAMTDAEFAALPYGSEGLWRKLMHASRREASLSGILAAVKSKRYTRTRLDRMVMSAFLGITQEILEAPVPYTRVLAFNDTGRALLRQAKKACLFLNPGEKYDHPYWDLEQRWGSLYGLFRVGEPDSPAAEKARRVRYLRDHP